MLIDAFKKTSLAIRNTIFFNDIFTLVYLF